MALNPTFVSVPWAKITKISQLAFDCRCRNVRVISVLSGWSIRSLEVLLFEHLGLKFGLMFAVFNQESCLSTSYAQTMKFHIQSIFELELARYDYKILALRSFLCKKE